MINNENINICSACKGKCCKRMPGLLHPDDLNGVTVEKLIDKLNNGYQFDYWEGNITGLPEHEDITAYYLRPSIKGEENRIVYGSWGGECVHLTPTGCKHKFEDRPYTCRHLEPNPSFKCNLPDGVLEKRELIILWLPYNHLIREAINLLNP